MGRLTFMALVITLSAVGLLPAKEGRSQDLAKIRVTLHYEHAFLEEILKGLEKQSGFTFTYPAKLGKLGPISIDVEDKSMLHALTQLSAEGRLRFSRTNRMLAVSEITPPVPVQQVKVTVRGRIVEFETSQPLPGATVMIVELNRGLAADEKGYYRFEGVPGGKYTIKVSFIGYETTTQQITAGEKDVVADIKLQGAKQLNTVVVKSGKRLSRAPVTYTTDKELLTEIKTSRAVVSGISNEQIVKSADRNAAEIVKRIPGVTVVDDKFIVVRGMNQRYNLTYLNDNLAPSTEVYNRAFAYDMLPSPIIDRILVYKSPAAELLGDYAGGAVKVFTKNAKPVRHLDVGVQLGYRDGTTFKDLNGYKAGNTDWLGFDDGSRKLPGIIPSYRESGGKNNLTQAQLLNAFSNNWEYGRLQALPDLQIFVNYFDNWRIGKWRLYDLTSVTYTKESRHIVQQRQTGNTYAYTLDKFGLNVGASNRTGKNDLSTQTAKISLLQNFTLKMNERNRLEFKNFLLNDGRSTTGVNIAQANVNENRNAGLFNYAEYKQNTLQFQQRFLYNGNLSGYHSLVAKRPQELHWNLGYSYSLQDMPDQRISRFRRSFSPGNLNGAEEKDLRWQVDYGTSENQMFYGMMNRFFVSNRENMYNGSADYAITVSPQLQFKAGTYQLYRIRSVDRRFLKVNRGGLINTEVASTDPGAWDNNGKIDPALLNFREQDLGKIWSPEFFHEDGTGLQLYDVSSPLDQYVASEQNNSGYIQGEWSSLNKKLILNAGLRFEHNVQQVSGAVEAFNTFLPTHVNLAKNSWLPSVNINYRPDSSLVLRASYGRTVNRPEFREIAPFKDFDFVNQEFISGNVLLKGTDIDNYDIRLELYPGRHQNETVSLGVFYKNLERPIERLRMANSTEGSIPQTVITYFNSDRAKVYGVELELRKSLGFMPGRVFRNMSAVLNGAWIKSEASRSKMPVSDNDQIVTIPGAAAGLFSGRPLQGQSPYVLNAGLYYENPAWGTKLGVMYNVNGPSIYALADANAEEILALRAKEGGYEIDELIKLGASPDLLELSRHLLDFSFTQRLYRSLQVRINVQNLLDEPVRIAEDQNYNHKYNKEVRTAAVPSYENSRGFYYYEGDNIFLQYRTGRYYNVTFTYAF
ncbi:TonB-dependent receptor [Chitinophaga sp. SYP-B3965]|uniref:TonB-dependent receptor n=1 Tax=Chitinophaga sp. SYP-B3965 TaxID=2663120 RepID=UPI001563521D|nr:TonB-dependent receptor [Chitinophaga sp. SYP-B3965]